MTNLADELERLAKEAHAAPWVGFADKGFVIALMPAGRPGDVCTFTADEQSTASADLIVALRNALPQIISALRREDDLKASVIAFCAPHAARYAEDFGLPPGSLHPTHYDLLQRCGARMDDFTRADERN